MFTSFAEPLVLHASEIYGGLESTGKRKRERSSAKEALAARGFCALRGVLTADELQLLREDARCLLADLQARGGDLVEEACVLDPVPHGIPEGHEARTDIAAYVGERRARHRPQCRSELSPRGAPHP